jgi:hypothetical protein
MNRMLLGAFLAGALVSAMPAAAAEITYSLSGTFDVNLNGTVYNDIKITFAGVGDTDGIYFTGGTVPNNLLTSLTATVDGLGVVTLPDSYTFFSSPAAQIAGVYDNFTDRDIFDIQASDFATFDAASNLGPISVVWPDGFFPGGNIPSDYGVAFIVGASDLTFASVVSGTPPIDGVPEPGIWITLLVGFGSLGAMTRFRNRATAAAAQ